jgi:hypothetical protein
VAAAAAMAVKVFASEATRLFKVHKLQLMEQCGHIFSSSSPAQAASKATKWHYPVLET